jgi:mono/diheme cytochrome c family protein
VRIVTHCCPNEETNQQSTVARLLIGRIENFPEERIPMTKWLKRIGLGLAVLFALVLVVALTLMVVGGRRAFASMEIAPETVTVPTDAAAIDNGKRLATIRGCAGCHGEDLAGQELFDVSMLGRLYATNLTGGQGGVAAEYTDADWVQAIRHGVAKDGRVLWIMPSNEFNGLSGQDLGALIAYLKQVPAVDRENPTRQLGPLGRIVVGVGGLPIPANEIDHSAPIAAAPAPAASVEYGAYLATACQGCHGANLAGGQAGPDDPPAPNLTPAGNLGGWDEAGFIQTIRTGVTPEGRQLSDSMPWQGFAQLSDTELQAIWLYLHSLPPTQ